MKKCPILFLTLVLLALTTTYRASAAAAADTKSVLVKQKWILNSRSFASHDKDGTDSNTVAGSKSDFIKFGTDGTVVVSYRGNKDILDYRIVGDNLFFGTSVYKIILLSDTALKLYQNEEEPNGDYYREWLELMQ